MYASIAIVVSALAALTAAQTSTTNDSASSTQYMPASATSGFDSSEVSASTKESWCLAELNTCRTVCGSASTNTCDDTSLTYECTCSNGTTPDLTAYTNSLPYYICQETYIQCIEDHPNDADGQADCAEAEVCGTLNATSAATSSAAASSTAAASTTLDSSSAAATSAAASATNTSSSSGAVPVIRTDIATAGFAGLLLVAVSLLL
ncbi:hypothetical protein UCRPC4_g00166 [Phaeomoniella chlamydospora]|uniref:DUF7707 domain-containing protein n=1 Tax=Phaeomoniella chlamydospora TaxID=158046 RepID=A0A0G2F4F3_PHACM|nr:hypothetical protein UCRPC4_g00166 [Phaeomoniella chlamydospora]